MSTAVSNAAWSTAPESPVARSVRLVRVVALLLAGFAITFTATAHEQLGFDLGISTAALGAIGVAHLIEWVSRRAKAPTVLPLLLGVVAIIAAIGLPFVETVVGFALVIAAWALVSALLEFIGAAVQPGMRQDATLVGAAGVLLSLLVLLVREDQVAVLGFFGAYAVLTGVFLGISAFDVRRAGASERSTGEPRSAEEHSATAAERPDPATD